MLLIQEKFPHLEIVPDVGNYDNAKMCVMSATVAEYRLRNGVPLGTATDELDCVCPIIRRFAICLNDLAGYWTDADRLEWALALVPRLIDSRGDKAITLARLDLAIAFARRVAAQAAQCAKTAKYAAKAAAKSSIYAKYGKFADKFADKYTESAHELAAEYAEYVAKSAAKSSKSAKYAAKLASCAAENAEYAADYAADYAAKAAADYAADYAARYVVEYVVKLASCAAENAEYAADYAARYVVEYVVKLAAESTAETTVQKIGDDLRATIEAMLAVKTEVVND